MSVPGISADERLRLQEEILRFAGVGMHRYRFDGTILDINEASFDILELRGHFNSPADVVGHKIEDVLRYVDKPGRLRDLIRKCGEARNILYHFRTLDGVEKWAIHDSFAVVDPATGELVVQAVFKDVTEIHRAQEALRASEERLTRIVETIAEGITIVDARGHITFANAAAERILGLSRSDITQRTYNDPGWKITSPEGKPFPEEELPFARVIRTGEPVYDVEHAIEGPEGTRVILSINAAPLRDATGAVVGVVASLADITERRRLERLRDEFLATAAHELKTPVTTIKGYAQLLRRWAPERRSPREGKALEAINAQCDRISRRLQEMLEVVRFRAPRPALHRERLDLGELASQVVQRLQTGTQLHQLDLEREAPTPVEADRERIEQVLASLLDNAIRFSPKGGHIEVRVRAREGNAVVSVKDHGVGIPKERQPHVFEPFYEPIPPGAPGYQSVVALGLYLSKLTLERHKGRIGFESEEGKGSTFYFSLPLTEECGTDLRT